MVTSIKGNDTSTFGGQIVTPAPAFSYYQSSAQTLSSQTMTKLTFTSSEFDTTGGMFASSRFTPTVAGYYMMSGGFEVASTATILILRLYKNGLGVKAFANTSPSTVTAAFGSAMVYCNGSTDYIELYGYVNTGQNLNAAQFWRTYFQGHLVRAS